MSVTESHATRKLSDVDATFTFASNVDRAPIFVRRWLPHDASPRTAVQITHGIAEHSGRYDRFARFLADHGHAVYALDLRGHGNTAGRDHLGQAGPTAWEDMVADIHQLSGIILAEQTGVPLVAFGHSMGSALTQSHMQHHGDLLSGVALSGTMGAFPGIDEATFRHLLAELHLLATGPNADSPCPYFGELLAALNAPFTEGLSSPTGCEWQTSDPDEIRRFLTDPLCGAPFSNAMSHSVASGFADLWNPENEDRVPPNLPLLIVTGADDPVGANTTTIQQLITRYMAHGHLTLDYRFYASARHEILNETVRDQVHRDVESWLTQIP